jgi:hypothetical protein
MNDTNLAKDKLFDVHNNQKLCFDFESVKLNCGANLEREIRF